MPNKKNILVVGGTGFIGSYVVKNLVVQQDCLVSVLYNNVLGESEKISNVIYHQLDLEKSFIGLSGDLESTNIIIWLVPKTGMIESFFKNSNLGKLEKIVYASTMLVYPDLKVLQDESTKPEPQSDYEKGKVEEEIFLNNFFKSTSVKICIARVSNVYGNVKNKEGRVHKIIEKIKTDESYPVNNDGSEMRDYIFVEDVANILEFLIFCTQTKQVEIFNVCTGIGTSTIDLISGLEKVFKKELKSIPGTGSIKNNIGDNSKILHISGYRLKYDLASGLTKTYENYSKLRN